MKRSYFFRILLKLFSLTLIPSILFPLSFYIYQRHLMFDKLKESAKLLSDAIARNAVDSLITGFPVASLTSFLDTVFLNSDLSGVYIYDNNGHLLLSRLSSSESKDLKLQPTLNIEKQNNVPQIMKLNNEKYVMSRVAVYASLPSEESLFGIESHITRKRNIGSVQILINNRGIVRQSFQALTFSIFLFLILSALSLILAYHEAIALQKPIEAISNAFKDIEGGNYNSRLEIPPFKELSRLALQFNITAQRLKETIKEKDEYSAQILTTASELEDLNENLEGEVKQRTQALENVNEMLRLTNEKIKEADKLKSEFLANMSHELRTPLNAIIGFSEVLIEGLSGPITAEQRQCLEDILNSGKHLLSLINDILDLSRVEAGRVSLNFATFDLQKLFSELKETFIPLVSKKNQTFIVSIPQDLETLYSDEIKVRQILTNLLGNATKFTKESGLIILDAVLADNEVIISIKDTGIGIAPKDITIIFEPFRQADSSLARAQEGTGLGLTLCKRFTELMGGFIEVESELGKGSTFKIHLPRDPSKPIGQSENNVMNIEKSEPGISDEGKV